MQFQDVIVSNIRSMFEETEDGTTRTLLLPENNEQVMFVKSIVKKLCDACIYFSPECEEYMNQMQVLVVESDEVNAYTGMGSVLVVYTGLLDHFKKELEEGNISNYEEVGELNE